MAGSRPGGADLEARIGRLLTVGTLVSMALIAIGVLGMVVAGRSPLDEPPAFDLARLPGDLVALRPEAFLWLGLIGILATPAARVAAAGVGYLRGRERGMALVALLVLLVVAFGVLAGIVAPEARG
jgi:uncharacterized membrane protein